VIGGAVLAVVAEALEGAPVIAWTPRFIAVLAFLSLVASAAAFVAWFTETRRSRLDVLSAWTLLTPVVGIVLGAVVLGERASGWTAAGLVAVLVAMGMVLAPGRHRATPGPTP
ncbi:MAG: EamA family transporter, partial [Cellulomonas sp.]